MKLNNSSILSKERVAFVTGAGQGIGKAIAKRLYSDGFRVAVADISESTAIETVAELDGKDSDAIAVHIDVADRDSVFAAMDKAVSAFGDLHVVVNNAGVSQRKPLVKITPEEVQRVGAINIGGVRRGMQAAT